MSSTPLAIRQCFDWNHDPCPNFAGQIWYPHTAGAGANVWVIVSNRTANSSDPHAGGLCLTAPPSVSDGSAPNDDAAAPNGDAAVAAEECADAADGQTWKWVIDPESGGDAHPDHPGSQIVSTQSLIIYWPKRTLD
jgi:hypothetical protein